MNDVTKLHINVGICKKSDNHLIMIRQVDI